MLELSENNSLVCVARQGTLTGSGNSPLPAEDLDSLAYSRTLALVITRLLLLLVVNEILEFPFQSEPVFVTCLRESFIKS